MGQIVFSKKTKILQKFLAWEMFGMLKQFPTFLGLKSGLPSLYARMGGCVAL